MPAGRTTSSGSRGDPPLGFCGQRSSVSSTVAGPGGHDVAFSPVVSVSPLTRTVGSGLRPADPGRPHLCYACEDWFQGPCLRESGPRPVGTQMALHSRPHWRGTGPSPLSLAAHWIPSDRPKSRLPRTSPGVPSRPLPRRDSPPRPSPPVMDGTRCPCPTGSLQGLAE